MSHTACSCPETTTLTCSDLIVYNEAVPGNKVPCLKSSISVGPEVLQSNTHTHAAGGRLIGVQLPFLEG